MHTSRFTCARHMPVSQTGMSANKYIRFQCFADASARAQETAQLEKPAQSHMGEWKFYIPTLKSGIFPSNSRQEREYPLRDDRSGGPPLTAPACLRNRCFPSLA